MLLQKKYADYKFSGKNETVTHENEMRSGEVRRCSRPAESEKRAPG